mmetsp:Transcript_52724/g.122696  ORF Transcript_52724/g.122696 Transcript_52724/m.122696 type:complete len:100 (-) Transcript_52724:79-378(-)
MWNDPFKKFSVGRWVQQVFSDHTSKISVKFWEHQALSLHLQRADCAHLHQALPAASSARAATPAPWLRTSPLVSRPSSRAALADMGPGGALKARGLGCP